MIKHKYPGKLIVFEGIDGAGSTTQVDLFFKYLTRNKIKALKSAEPTGGLIGKMIRQALRGEIRFDSKTLQLLYTADRSDHLEREVIPALKKGQIVVLDRYVLSTLAYGLLNLDGLWLLEISKNFILPDVTFLVDTPVSEAMKRMGNRSRRELFEKEKLLKSVRKNYLDLAHDFGRDVEVLDGMMGKNEIFEEVLKVLFGRKIL